MVVWSTVFGVPKFKCFLGGINGGVQVRVYEEGAGFNRVDF